MIRDNVQHLTEPGAPNFLTEFVVRSASSKFFIHTVRVDNVISMPATWRGLQIGGAIHMRDAKISKIIRYFGSGFKAEL
jgi:hypothetical protein